MIYDTHSHPYLAKEKSQEVILENFFKDSKNRLNTIACDLNSSKVCVDLAKKYPGIYATIGIHPTHCLDYLGEEGSITLKLERLYQANSDHIVAIGEAGLDYYWLDSLSQKFKMSQEGVIQTQQSFFTLQIRLAKKLGLPLIIHNRESSEDILAILIKEDCQNFVFHCYSEDIDFAQRLLSHAPRCKIGFGGVVTFKNATKTQEAAKLLPLDNIIIETDSPYLTPTPYRGKQENEPIYCQNVLSQIIDLREESSETIKTAIYNNSLDFFRIK